MRINVYAEELKDRFTIVEDNTPDGKFTGLRFEIGEPSDLSKSGQIRSQNAVTLWGKARGEQLIPMLERAIEQLKAGPRAGADVGGQREPAHV